MFLVELENYDTVAVLRLANGVPNAIGPAVIKDFDVALKEVKDAYMGMVLTGGNKFFSIGLKGNFLAYQSKDLYRDPLPCDIH